MELYTRNHNYYRAGKGQKRSVVKIESFADLETLKK
jgi:hypothetical protein